MPPTTRPNRAVFAEHDDRRPLAIRREAIGATYRTRKLEDIAEVVDGVAVLSIRGPLEHHGSGGWWCYWENYEDLAAEFKTAIEDPSVRSVVLKFDSPGGECAGLNETVSIMKGMKEAAGKPVYAYVDEACYSAAYALAMVADAIYLPESGGVGSIGVITALLDVTKMNEKMGVRVEVVASGTKKTDGHPCVEISDGARKRTQKQVDKLAMAFFELVAEGRGLDVDTIEGFEAGVFSGQDAVDAGLADGVMSLQECLTIAREGSSASKNNAPRQSGKESKMPPANTAASKALSDAHKALGAAKTDAERALAAARVVAAPAAPAPTEPLAKVKKTKTVTTDTHEEEIDDGEPEEDDDEDEGDDEDAESESADADAEGEEGGKYKGAKVAAATIDATKDGLLRLARQITGKRSIEEVMGALHATWQASKKAATLASKVAKLEADATATRIQSLIAQGMKAGKLSAGQKAWAKTLTPAALKAYLDSAPKMVQAVDEGHTEAKVEGVGPGAVTAEMAKIWRKQGFAEKDFPALLATMNGATNGANGAS